MTTLAKSLRGDNIKRLRLRDVCEADPFTPIEEVVRRMSARKTGCVLILENDRLIGIFTERDFLSRVIAQGMDVSLPVGPVMTKAPKTIAHHASVHSAVDIMESGGYRHLPVIGEHDKPIGVLSVRDIVHYLVEYFPAKVYNLPPTPDQTQPSREGA